MKKMPLKDHTEILKFEEYCGKHLTNLGIVVYLRRQGFKLRNHTCFYIESLSPTVVDLLGSWHYFQQLLIL